MDCDLPHLFDVRAGRAPLDDVRFVTPPFHPGIHALPGKDLYGEPLEHHVEGLNFTVQWEGDDGTEAMARGYLDSLEAAWAALVEDQGWKQPVSTDQYLQWVILDPSLSATGFTTTYTTAEYPDGYPVMYVNPDWWADYEDFSRSVAVHEFSHALQYAVRDWSASEGESWYWEGSSEWMAELGAPSLDTYAWSAPYYAEHTAYAYDSAADAHQYGMFVLPASLDADDFQDSWEKNDGGDWVDEIADRAGTPFDELIGGMAAAYVAGTLRESDLYEEARYAGTISGPRTVDVDLYGTAIYKASGPFALALEGPGRLDFAVDGEVLDAAPDSGEFFVLVTRNDSGDLALVDEAVADDTDEPESEKDTGTGESGGCATVPGVSGWWVLAVVAVGWRRRRA